MKTLSASPVDTALFTLLSESATPTASARISPEKAEILADEIEEKLCNRYRTIKEQISEEISEEDITTAGFFASYSVSPFSDPDSGAYFVEVRAEGRTFLFLVFETNSLALSVEVISGPEEDETTEIITPAYRKENPDGGEGYFFFRTAFSASGTSRPDPRFYSVTVPLFY